MKRKIKSVKQLNRERELERQEKKRELEKRYLEEKREWEDNGLNTWYQFDSLEDYLEKNLDESDAQHLKIPTGKYLDEKRIVSNYQQKFMDYVRQLCPHIIEELREFVPYFEKVLVEQKEKYIDIFDRFKMEFFDLDISLDAKINNSIIKDVFLQFRPDKYQNRKYDYKWGEHYLLIHFLYFMFVSEENSEKRNEVLQNAVQLLQNNLVIECDYTNLPKDFDHSVLQNYIVKKSYEIILEMFSKDEHKFFFENARKDVAKFLQGISPTAETSVGDFIKLQFELLSWAERHNLQKDWLLRYAYFFISQFSNNPNVKLDDVEILYLDTRTLWGHSFEFQFNGWDAGGEDREDYEKRLTESFEAELQKYFHNVSNQYNLDKIKRITKPINYDLVKPLVRRNVQKWSFEKIVELDYEITDSISTKKEFVRRVKYLKEELPKLTTFDLPYKP